MIGTYLETRKLDMYKLFILCTFLFVSHNSWSNSIVAWEKSYYQAKKYIELGDMVNAKLIILENVETSKIIGADSFENILSLELLAILNLSEGRLQQVRKDYELIQQKMMNNPSVPDGSRVLSYSRYGDLLLDLGEYRLSAEKHKLAVQLIDNKIILDGAVLSTVYINLAKFYVQTNKVDQAKLSINNALNIVLKQDGETSYRLSKCYFLLALLAFNNQENDSAIEYFLKTIYVLKAQKIVDFDGIAQSNSFLGAIYEGQKNISKAEVFYKRAYEFVNTGGKINSVRSLNALVNYATFQFRQKRTAESFKIIKKSYQIAKRIYPKGSRKLNEIEEIYNIIMKEKDASD